ncbi:MAG: hypothetical protein Q8K70_07745 [Bacteroidota bacterium]|nr:hypothetical protein [Bacteroidota bacterium]
MMMRSLLLFLLLISLAHSIYSQKSFEQWKASQKGTYFYLNIFDDSTFVLLKSKDTLVGNHMIYNNEITKSKINVDTLSKPHKLDLVIYDANMTTVVFQYLGIFEMLGKQKMRVRFDFGEGKRPEHFQPLGNPETLLFIKQ